MFSRVKKLQQDVGELSENVDKILNNVHQLTDESTLNTDVVNANLNVLNEGGHCLKRTNIDESSNGVFSNDDCTVPHVKVYRTSTEAYLPTEFFFPIHGDGYALLSVKTSNIKARSTRSISLDLRFEIPVELKVQIKVCANSIVPAQKTLTQRDTMPVKVDLENSFNQDKKIIRGELVAFMMILKNE